MAGLVAHLRLGAFELGDVEGYGDHFRDPAGVVEQRRLGGQQDPLVARAGRDHLVLEARHRLSGLEHLGIEHEMLGRLILAVDLDQRLPRHGSSTDPIQLLVRAVDQGQAAAGIDRADHRRHGVDQPAQAKLAGPERGLMLLGARQQFPAQLVGALLEQLLLLAQGQKIARPGAELMMVDRAQQEVRGPGFERLIAVAALLVHRHDHDRNLERPRNGPERPGEVGAVHLRHLEIGDHQVRHGALDPVERRLRAGERLDPDAFLDRGRQPRQNIAVGHPIVDDDYVGHERAASTIIRTKSGRSSGQLPPCLAEGLVSIKRKVKSRRKQRHHRLLFARRLRGLGEAALISRRPGSPPGLVFGTFIFLSPRRPIVPRSGRQRKVRSQLTGAARPARLRYRHDMTRFCPGVRHAKRHAPHGRRLRVRRRPGDRAAHGQAR